MLIEINEETLFKHWSKETIEKISSERKMSFLETVIYLWLYNNVSISAADRSIDSGRKMYEKFAKGFGSFLNWREKKYEVNQIPETWEDLRKIASDMCIEKKIDLRFLDDGSFVILFPNNKLIFCSLNSVKKSYYKLLWALEE